MTNIKISDKNIEPLGRPLNSHGFTVCHTVLLPSSRSHGRFLIPHNFTNFEQIFFQTHSFPKKQPGSIFQCSEECIFSMVNKNTSNCSSLSLSWALLFIMLVKTHIDNSFQWKLLSDLLKIAKKFTTEYNRQHSSK